MSIRSLLILLIVSPALAQQQPPGILPMEQATPFKLISPAVPPTLSPGAVMLIELEGRFAQSVEEGGGKAFATWFAEDAVTLNNGKPAVLGRGAIAEAATWDPKVYTLSWVAQGAQMGPSNDMGYTWGHYEGRSKDAKGSPVTSSGRYITIWRKSPDGSWKVVLDASAEDAAAPAPCCSAAKP